MGNFLFRLRGPTVNSLSWNVREENLAIDRWVTGLDYDEARENAMFENPQCNDSTKRKRNIEEGANPGPPPKTMGTNWYRYRKNTDYKDKPERPWWQGD